MSIRGRLAAWRSARRRYRRMNDLLSSVESSLARIANVLELDFEARTGRSLADQRLGRMTGTTPASEERSFLRYPDRKAAALREETLRMARVFNPDLALLIEQEQAAGGANAEEAELRRVLEEAERAVREDPSATPWDERPL